MANQREYAARECGGSQARDYTRQRRVDGRRGLARIDFNRISRALVYLSLGLGAMDL